MAQRKKHPNPYTAETISHQRKRILYSIGLGTGLLYLLILYMDRHHTSLHQEDSFHTLAQEQEEALAAIPDIGDLPLIEGTEDIWGANEEDDCTPGELDCNKILPLLEDEPNNQGNETLLDSSSGVQDDENSNTPIPSHSAPVTATATLPQNQNHIHRPDITKRGSIRGGKKSSSLASPSKRSKSEIIFGERPPAPTKRKSKTNQKSSSLASPSSQSKSAIVFGERRPSGNHGITERDKEESSLASPSSNSEKSAIVFGEGPPTSTTVYTHTKVTSSNKDDVSEIRSKDELDVGSTSTTTTAEDMTATKTEEGFDEEDEADTTISTRTFEDELEVLEQDPDSLLVSKSSADEWDRR